MTDNIKVTVEINGKKVPLSSISDETISQIRKQELAELEKNAPVFSKIDFRLIVKLTPRLIHTFRRIIEQLNRGSIKENHYMSFEPNGFFGCYDLGSTLQEAGSFYSGQTAVPIFYGD